MDKDKAEKFGKWLTRKFLDLQSQSGRMWTISEFAKYLGCPQQSVSRWMAGGSLPDSARAIYKLRDKFGTEVDTILGIEGGNILALPLLIGYVIGSRKNQMWLRLGLIMGAVGIVIVAISR